MESKKRDGFRFETDGFWIERDGVRLREMESGLREIELFTSCLSVALVALESKKALEQAYLSLRK